MSTTNPITGVTTGSATSANSIPANMQINQTDFLQLITAQLQDQNPLQPADPTQFVSQLEGMSEVSSMQSMQSSLQASQLLSGTSLLGQSILAPGSTATLAAGGAISGAVTAPAGASQLNIAIVNSSGSIVSSFGVTPQPSGLTPFSWNGTTSSGSAAPAGTYTVQVSATVKGSTQPVNPLVVSKVQSVMIDPSNQGVDLTTDSGTVALSSVVSVL
ncbi:MAG TPA: FlgD immunoglobulin-like domain containing protein [Steroidobacteraceae bacterium]